MKHASAGLLLYRRSLDTIEVFLGHMGGPFWSKKDEGAWTIPKGEFDPENESAFAAAIREFEEETGYRPAMYDTISLPEIQQKGGKKVQIWAVEDNQFNGKELQSNSFELEWPPRSGNRQVFPELDRGGWFTLDLAKRKILTSQVVILEHLEEKLKLG